MAINYNASINYYSFLLQGPLAWELFISQSTVVNRGDTINVIEVDSMGNPTGNSMTGKVSYIACNDFFLDATKSNLVYIIPD